MTESRLAFKFNVQKPYFIGLINDYFKDLRFNTTIENKGIGVLDIFLDSFQVIDIHAIDNQWVLDLSTIVKIANEKRKISLAGLTRSKVYFTLINNQLGDLALLAGDIDFNWKSLKTSVNGTPRKGMDSLVKTILNLSESTISSKLRDLLADWVNNLQKPYIIQLPPLNILDTPFKSEFYISKLLLSAINADDHHFNTIIHAAIQSKMKDQNDDGELVISKVSLKEFVESKVISHKSLLNVSLSDDFINTQINRSLGDLLKENDAPFEVERVSLNADDDKYKVQIETNNKAAEKIDFELTISSTEFSNFPEIELDAFGIQGKGFFGSIAKQVLKVYKRKLSNLISQKWLDFIAAKGTELKSNGINYYWKGLSIHVPVIDLSIEAHEINKQTGLTLKVNVTTGQITVSNKKAE